MTALSVNAPPVPRATYRLQFNEQFRLAAALALVPYLAELGISHIYASPLFQAAPHSTHSYDVQDFAKLNPELGTEADLEQLVAALRAHGMGLVLDIVPNHMGIGGTGNPYWWDVLKHGRASRFANFFDIAWRSDDSETDDKVVLPVLGEPLESLLQKGEFKVTESDGEPFLTYYENKFPLSPASLPASADVAQLLNSQPYRLVHWREGDQLVNYRRFFNINSLAGLRVEDPAVFDASHALLKQWLERGWLAGLRVDHIDGLRDPFGYLQNLRRIAGDAWVVVEKILQPNEALPTNWPVAGTSGYDALATFSAWLVDGENEKAISDFYEAFTGDSGTYAETLLAKKRLVLEQLFPAEIDRLIRLLTEKPDGHAGAFDPEALRGALIEILAAFPVYRNYSLSAPALTTVEIANVDNAIRVARAQRTDLPPKLFDYFADLLTLRLGGETTVEFVARFQQLAAPAMAKGGEDTAFYSFNRFIALNEVGGDPGRFGLSTEALVSFCATLDRDWPQTLIGSSTHDTKRGEDARARLAVISEIPQRWFEWVECCSRRNQSHWQNHPPDRNLEYLFYQTIVGAWPLSPERLLPFLEKAVREAKVHTSWNDPNKAYETAVRDFATAALNDSQFTAEVEKFCTSIQEAGWINSLSLTLLKLTAVGVPDFYQGSELGDFSLVDPDNRRPVDFELRRKLLASSKTISAADAWCGVESGLAKLWLIRKLLHLRREQPHLFTGRMDCSSLSISGRQAPHLFAFRRNQNAITVLQRFPLKRGSGWTDATLALPPGAWRNELTGELFAGKINATTLFSQFPIAFLTRKDSL